MITGAAPSRYRVSPGLFIARNDAIHRTVSIKRTRKKSFSRENSNFFLFSFPPSSKFVETSGYDVWYLAEEIAESET